MKTDKQIEQYYEEKIDFLYDNRDYMVNSLIFYRKMIAKAAKIIENHQDSSESKAWMAEFERLESIEDV